MTEPPGEGDAGGGRVTGAPGGEPDALTASHETVVRAYAVQLAGSARGPEVAARALAELSAASDGGPPDLVAVARAARAAGLEQLDADARRAGRRLARAARGQFRCAGISRQLRDRAAGQMSADELSAFYRHLERCYVCAATTRRFEAGEWYLRVELGLPGTADTRRRTPEPSAPDAPAPAPAVRAPGSTAGPAGRPSTGQETAIDPDGVVAGPPARRPRALRVAAAAVALLAAGAVAIVLLRHGASKPSSTPQVIHPTTITIGTTVRPAPIPILAHRAGAPFVVAGASFAASVGARPPWTSFARRATPGPGNRWVLVTLAVRNLHRTGFDPRALHYRLLAPGAASYFPIARRGTARDTRLPPRPVPAGGRVQVELAFQVPTAATALRLAFDPTGRHARVVVALGAG